jgi:transposase
MGKHGRRYTKEEKEEAVRLVRESGQSVPQVARQLGIGETALYSWVKQAKIDAGEGPPDALTTAEKEELRKLRREVKNLRMEREFLKKAAAFFARETETSSK